MLQILGKWFFSTPTPIITILSFLIAYMTYLYQRKWNRKQKAHQISEWYAKVAIPKTRYIRRVMEAIGNGTYTNKFTEINYFTSNELEKNLEAADCSRQKFIDNFSKLDEDILDNAFSLCGCNEYMHKSHIILKEAIKDSKQHGYEVFDRFVIDFLNEMETVALQINCNFAEGNLIYPILHQTFLKNMKNWYFFISKENQFDHNRYYPNIISLYLSWNYKSIKDENDFNQSANRKNKIKKI